MAAFPSRLAARKKKTTGSNPLVQFNRPWKSTFPIPTIENRTARAALHNRCRGSTVGVDITLDVCVGRTGVGVDAVLWAFAARVDDVFFGADEGAWKMGGSVWWKIYLYFVGDSMEGLPRSEYDVLAREEQKAQRMPPAALRGLLPEGPFLGLYRVRLEIND